MNKIHNRARITFLNLDGNELGDIEFKTTEGVRSENIGIFITKLVTVNYLVSARTHALQRITKINNMTDDKFVVVSQDGNDMVRRSDIERIIIEEYTVEEDNEEGIN